MPKIRHLAIVCMDPEKLAKFYCEVFDMKIVQRNGRSNVFVSDGYITVALLSQKAEGKPCGLNHFGFHVEDSDVIAERMKNWNVVGPSSGRPIGPMRSCAPPIRKATISTSPKAASTAARPPTPRRPSRPEPQRRPGRGDREADLRALVAAAALILLAGPCAAQPLGDVFKGKQIRFVLGAAPGQDYDSWARLIGRHLPAHIAGAPTVIVQNMPGAGHMVATNWLYNVAPRDGTVWGMVSRNIPNAACSSFRVCATTPSGSTGSAVRS